MSELVLEVETADGRFVTQRHRRGIRLQYLGVEMSIPAGYPCDGCGGIHPVTRFYSGKWLCDSCALEGC